MQFRIEKMQTRSLPNEYQGYNLRCAMPRCLRNPEKKKRAQPANDAIPACIECNEFTSDNILAIKTKQ